jgi:hypothetical protein
VPPTSKTAIAAGTVVLNRPPITRGTDSSNPSPSSGESGANFASSDKVGSVLPADEARLAGGSPKADEPDLAQLFVQVGRRVRIRLPPAESLLRT